VAGEAIAPRWAAVIRGIRIPLSVDFTSNMDEASGLLPSVFTPTPTVWEKAEETKNKTAIENKMRFMKN
jgi:hypothetical protein